MNRLVLTVVTIAALLVPSLAWADPRPFTFVSDAYSVGKGGWEIEQWVTYKGHTNEDSGFAHFDFRTEFEFGLADNFDLAIYMPQWSYEDSDSRSGTHFDGGAIEGVFYFTNPVKDFVGLALYGEINISDDELEFENKLIVQKDIGKWVFAYNLVLETELEHVFDKDEETEVEGVIENTFGVSYALSRGWLLGAELIVSSEFEDWDDYITTTVYAGPNVSYQGGHFGKSGTWWVTVTPTFQLTDEEDDPDFQVRAIFGISF
jgi:hypothetical protein